MKIRSNIIRRGFALLAATVMLFCQTGIVYANEISNDADAFLAESQVDTHETEEEKENESVSDNVKAISANENSNKEGNENDRSTVVSGDSVSSNDKPIESVSSDQANAGTVSSDDANEIVSADIIPEEQETEEAVGASPESYFEWYGEHIISKYIGPENIEVVIPSHVTIIKKEAFRDHKLKKISFENKSDCRSIEVGAFYGCGLEELELPNNPDNIVEIQAQSFENNNIKSLVIPQNVRQIFGGAFANNLNLNYLRIESEKLELDGAVFKNDHVTELSFKDTITSVPDNLFLYADLSGVELVLPKQITKIGNCAFQDSHLKKISFQGNVTEIWDYAFEGTDISNIDFPASLERIHKNAFEHSKLESLTLPKNLKQVDEMAFAYCDNIKEVIFNPTSISSWESYAFFGIKPDKVTIGSNVTIIPNGLFYTIRDVTPSLAKVKLTIPASVTVIGAYAFYQSGLDNIKIEGNNLKSIGESAFYECPIKELNLPSSVREIGARSFAYNKALTRIVLPQKLKKLEDFTFGEDKFLNRIAIYKDTKMPDFPPTEDPFNAIGKDDLLIYGYPGSPAEKFANSYGYKFMSISEWGGGNPYKDEPSGDSPIVIGAGQSGLDGAVKLNETAANTYSAEMVKGQKFSFGKGKWSSNNKSAIAIVSKTGVATAKNAGNATLKNEKNGMTINVTVYHPMIEGNKKLTMHAGSDAQKVSLSGLTGSGLEVAWISSNQEIVSVKENGSSAEITPLGVGKAKVTAYVCGRAYAYNVTVKGVFDNPVLSGSGSITVNTFQPVTLKYSKGFKVKKAVWTDEAGNALVADSDVYVKNGKLTANKVVSNMTIKGNDGNSTVTLTVTSKAIPTRSVMYINKGQTRTYKNNYVKGGGMLWTTSDNSIISLANSDKAKVKLTGSSTGTAILTCKYKGVGYETLVYVEDPSPKTTSITTSVGNIETIELNKISRPMILKSSNKSVVFVDENLNIYARKKGTAKITGKVNNRSIKITVKVND